MRLGARYPLSFAVFYPDRRLRYTMSEFTSNGCKQEIVKKLVDLHIRMRGSSISLWVASLTLQYGPPIIDYLKDRQNVCVGRLSRSNRCFPCIGCKVPICVLLSRWVLKHRSIPDVGILLYSSLFLASCVFSLLLFVFFCSFIFRSRQFFCQATPFGS